MARRMKRRKLAISGDMAAFQNLLRGGPGPPATAKAKAPGGGGGAGGPSARRVTIEQTFGGTGTGEAEDEWKPVAFKRPGWEKCFGCEYGLAEPDESQPALQGLWDLFRDNFGREMPNATLAQLMHEFFEQHIRAPMLARGAACPEWSAEAVLEHIEVHLLCPAVTVGVQLQNIKYCERLMLQGLRLQHAGSGATKVDLKVLKSVLEVQKHIQSLYNAKPSKQLFYSSFLKLDDRRAHQ